MIKIFSSKKDHGEKPSQNSVVFINPGLLFCFNVLSIFINEANRDCIHELKDWEEAVGFLQNIEIGKDTIILEFLSGMKIRIFEKRKEFINKLKTGIGKKVSLLKTDLVGKEHCLIIEDKKIQSSSKNISIKNKPKKIMNSVLYDFYDETILVNSEVSE